MNARRLHRGAMTVFVVLIAYWVISGLLLAVFDFTDDQQAWAVEGGGPGAPLHAADSAALPPLPTMQQGIWHALDQAAAMDIASVRLYMAGDQPRIEFATADGNRARMARFDAVTGLPVPEYFESVVAGGASRATRESLKAWHKGNAAGLIGQGLGILTGVGVILLAISGLCVYGQLWRSRTRIRRRSLFWKAGTRWQQLHRGVAIVAAAFILNIAITGVILGAGEFQLRLFLDHQIGSPPYPRPGRMPPVSEGTLQIPLVQALTGIEQRFGQESLRAIEIVHREGTEKADISFGADPKTQTMELASGQLSGIARAKERQSGNGYFADWHQVLKRMHRGDIIGHFSGRALDICAGLAIAYLLISGLIMYTARMRRGTP